ncbi:MAG: hypothetical protein ACK5KP_05425 [Paludibacteraceae bacterium]
MTALLIASFVILLSYILYAGVAESLSATYYKVKKPYLFQIALGLTGFLMMVYLLDLTAGKWYQFLSFFATSALIFVAFAPDYRQMLEGKVHADSAYVSAVASVVLIVLFGCWYIPVSLLSIALLISFQFKNRIFWLEMACFGSVFLTILIISLK